MLRHGAPNSTFAAIAIAAAVVSVNAAVADAQTLKFVSITKQTIRTNGGMTQVDLDRSADGRLLGVDTVQCRYQGTTAHCVIAVNLGDGTLYLSKVDHRPRISSRIVAATGIFAGDAGTLLSIPLSAKRTQVTVRLHRAPTVQSANPRVHTLRFVSSLHWVYVPGGFVMTDLDSRPGGRPLGSDTVNCRAHTRGCYATIDLPSGTLYIALLLGHAGDTGRVVSGTGQFAGAHGRVAVKDINSTRSMVTVEFHFN